MNKQEWCDMRAPIGPTHKESCKIACSGPHETDLVITDCIQGVDCWRCEESVPHRHGPVDPAAVERARNGNPQ